jgi:hypothetical protein
MDPMQLTLAKSTDESLRALAQIKEPDCALLYACIYAAGGNLALQSAARQLEWAHPYCPTTGVVLDVGTAPVHDVNGCRAAIRALIAAGARTTSGLLQDPSLSTSDLLALVRVLPLVSTAQTRVNGNPP